MSAPALAAPAHRIPAFADALRRRGAPRGVPSPARSWRPAAGRTPQLDRILHLAARPLVVHQHHHRHAAGPASVHLRLSLAVDAGGPSGAPGATGRVVPRVPGPVREPGEPGRVPAGAPPAIATSPRIGRRRAVVPGDPLFAASTAVRPASARVRVVMRDAAWCAAPQPLSPQIEMVHRSAAAAVARADAPPAPPSPASPIAVHWNEPPRTFAAPLTSADIPRVVDRVVGEIDRRITAARERRGWTA